MEEKLMKVSCDPECGFMVQSHDKKELVGIVKAHAKKMHKKSVSDEDVMEKMEEA